MRKFLLLLMLVLLCAGCGSKKVVVDKSVAVDSVLQYHKVDSVVIDSTKEVSKIDTSAYHFEYEEITYDTDKLDSAGCPLVKKKVTFKADKQNRQSEQAKISASIDQVQKTDTVISGKRQDVVKEEKDVKSFWKEIESMLWVVLLLLVTFFIIMMYIKSAKHTEDK